MDDRIQAVLTVDERAGLVKPDRIAAKMPFPLLHLRRVLLDSVFSHAAIAVVGLEQVFGFVRPYPLQAQIYLLKAVFSCVQ